MADIINLSDVSTEDDSKLKTGGRRSYKMAIHKGGCPSGEHLVKGKCIPRKKGKKDYGIKRLSPEEVKEYKKKKSKKELYNVTKQKAIKQGYI